jgi:hypothetical protein
MAPRALTEAAVLKQLKTVGDKLAGKATGEKRLALLRRQAELGDQRDAADQARRSDAGKTADRSSRSRG